jgi:hypothetical protein
VSLGYGGYGSCVVLTATGNVVVAGTPLSGVSGDTPIWGTVFYTPAGTALWTNRFAPSGGSPKALVLDAQNNIIVGGEYTNAWAIVKYSGSGVPLWTNFYVIPNNGYGTIDDLAVDASGNIFAAGVEGTMGVPGSYNFAMIEYSAAGVPIWTNFYGAAKVSPQQHTGSYDPYSSLTLDAGGNIIFFCQQTNTTATHSFNCAQVRYSSTGAPLDTNLFLVPVTSTYAGMARDAAGNVFINAGSMTLAYNSTGVPLWTNSIPNALTSDTYVNLNIVAVDKQGSVFATDYVSSNSDDYVTVKYSNAGVPLWTNYYNGPGNNKDMPNALVLDKSGNVYVTGTTVEGFTFSATIKYSNDGVPLWTNICSTYSTNAPLTPYGPFSAYAMAVDNSAGNLYVTGGAGGICTVKYSGPPPPLSFMSANSGFGFAGGQFSLLLAGPPGSNAVISGSSDLQTWVPLITNPLTGGTFMFTDTLATNYLQRYYRAVLQ